MVAKSPTKDEKKMAVLNPNLVRETVKKVDRAMARLQELQFAVTGGNKVISGVTLSPRSTRGYIRTSMRCKQESLRFDNGIYLQNKKLEFFFLLWISSSIYLFFFNFYVLSSSLRFKDPELLRQKRCDFEDSSMFKREVVVGCSETGEWRRMSLPAMLIGETVGEILQASKFAKDVVDAVSGALSVNGSGADDPKTPISAGAKVATNTNLDKRELQMKRKREKQKSSSRGSPGGGGGGRSPTTATARRRKAHTRINFRATGAGNEKERCPPTARRENHSVQRVSPRGRPWAGKAVLFPNPTFLSAGTSSPPSSSRNLKPACKTRSPVTAGSSKVGVLHDAPALHPPHKFAIKSPSTLASKFAVKIKSPPVSVVSLSPQSRSAQKKKKSSPPPTKNKGNNMPRISKATKLRLSLSPSNFAKRFASPMKIISPSVRRAKSPTSPTARITPSKKKSPQPRPPSQMMMTMMSSSAKFRRSFSPSNLAKRFASPLKNRTTNRSSLPIDKNPNMGIPVPAITSRPNCCLKQRPPPSVKLLSASMVADH
ncbi:putative microtubule-binding protein TANGLED [Nymphaea thermarum]|nr:putative microtubule-binding protein TANGLED [Nymphaea thermarum]